MTYHLTAVPATSRAGSYGEWPPANITRVRCRTAIVELTHDELVGCGQQPRAVSLGRVREEEQV